MSEPAQLVELFSSIQGEGMIVGLRQVFLRFHGCNLACDYCDTPVPSPPTDCLLEQTPGARDFISIANPVSLELIADHLAKWQGEHPGIHHSLSITGGEPLLHHRLLQSWLPVLAPIILLYLETNGVLAEELATVITHLSLIGMDIKLPSTSGCGDLWERHRLFLEVAQQKPLFVKVVVDDTTEAAEVARAATLIAEVNRAIPLIIQPLTRNDGSIALSPPHMLTLQESAASRLDEVRVIPQIHKGLGIL
jgi:organic radical activating enzyme